MVVVDEDDVLMRESHDEPLPHPKWVLERKTVPEWLIKLKLSSDWIKTTISAVKTCSLIGWFQVNKTNHLILLHMKESSYE